MDLGFVNIIEESVNAEIVMDLKFVSITSLSTDAQIAMDQKYAKHTDNRIIQVVEQEEGANMTGSALTALPIYFLMTLGPLPLKSTPRNFR